MRHLLAIETCTEACGVALWSDGRLYERQQVVPRRHAELVLGWCGELLDEAGVDRRALDAIAVGRGPGAFTGVRLGVAVAQGLAFALERPLFPVSTLHALALQAAPDVPPGSEILAAIDARMDEVYLGRFCLDAEGWPQPFGAEWMQRPELVEGCGDASLCGIGSGFRAGDAALGRRLGTRLSKVLDDRFPRAADVARIAVANAASQPGLRWDAVEPAYLRDKVALTLEERAQRT